MLAGKLSPRPFLRPQTAAKQRGHGRCGEIHALTKKVTLGALLLASAPMSRTLTVEYPDTLPDALNMSCGEFERDARMAMAAKLYEIGRLSAAEAARLAGLDRVRFFLALERFGVSMLNSDTAELEKEISQAREAFAGRQ